MNISLVTFPAPLLRLILCGGEGLPPAWGPVLQAGSQVLGCGDPSYGQWAWDAVLGAAVRPDRAPKYLLDKPDGWSLPLDADSPWPARLAMVAAWMVHLPTGNAFYGQGASVYRYTLDVSLRLMSGASLHHGSWHVMSGRALGHSWTFGATTDLPTLPQHLQTHPPAVALLLALYDVPEIRARVGSA